MLINSKQVREAVRHYSLNMSVDFTSKLELEISATIQKACARAIENKRTTVMSRDV